MMRTAGLEDPIGFYFHQPATVSEGIFARIYWAISFSRSAVLTGPV